MTPEDFVQELLNRGLEAVLEQALTFAQTHWDSIKDIKPAQWQRLRQEVVKTVDGPELFACVKAFLAKQKKRGERAGTTPWEKLAGPLIEKLESLPRDLQLELETCLKDLARQGQSRGRLDPSLVIDLQFYCHETRFTASRQGQWQFACLQGFLFGLLRLMRGNDIQKEHPEFFKFLE